MGVLTGASLFFLFVCLFVLDAIVPLSGFM